MCYIIIAIFSTFILIASMLIYIILTKIFLDDLISGRNKKKGKK